MTPCPTDKAVRKANGYEMQRTPEGASYSKPPARSYLKEASGAQWILYIIKLVHPFAAGHPRQDIEQRRRLTDFMSRSDPERLTIIDHIKDAWIERG
jgi:hypothetical protein